MAGSWYDQGFGGINEEEKRLESMQGPHRLWIPGGLSKDVVWVDDEPVCIHEHNPKINGNYRNWMTCLRNVYDEVVCCTLLGPNSRYYVGYVTGVDCSQWKDQKGNTHQYELRLIQLKLRSLKKFRRKKEDRGSMVGTMWRLTREDDNAPTCGDDWDFSRDVDMSKMFDYICYRGTKLTELWADAEKNPETMVRMQKVFQIKPDSNGKLPREIPAFNYFEVLQPMSPKEARIHLGAVEKDDDNRKPSNVPTGSPAAAVKEDQVPF